MKIMGVVLFILGLCKLTASLIKHYYINERMTWSDAQEFCRLYYKDLSTINNLNELQQLNAGSSVYSWIGLYRDDESESEWKWSGGEDTDFRCWSSEEPSSVSGYDCARVLNKKKKWSATDCSLRFTFFCMKPWRGLIFVQQKKTWGQALEYCRDQYTDLASLLLEEENALAVNISQAAQTAFVWIGLRFLAGHWFWVSRHYLGYQALATEEQFQCPARNLYCGALETNSEIWMPIDCEEELNFICF